MYPLTSSSPLLTIGRRFRLFFEFFRLVTMSGRRPRGRSRSPRRQQQPKEKKEVDSERAKEGGRAASSSSTSTMRAPLVVRRLGAVLVDVGLFVCFAFLFFGAFPTVAFIVACWVLTLVIWVALPHGTVGMYLCGVAVWDLELSSWAGRRKVFEGRFELLLSCVAFPVLALWWLGVKKQALHDWSTNSTVVGH